MKLRKIFIAGFLSQTFTKVNYCSLLRYQKHSQRESLDWDEVVCFSQLSSKKINQFREFWQRMVLNELPLGNLNYLTILDNDYPLRLKESYNPPYVLSYLGDIRLLKTKCLGIVGGRIHSAAVGRIIKSFSPEFVKDKVTIVSGLARGIDTVALTTAMEQGGSVIAVIGSGIGQFYPLENKWLQKNISRNHLLISEYVFDQPPRRFHFPQRNRIIAGLVQGVLVASAKHHSGSLITANLALQNNREIFALPGLASDPLMTGSNELIQAGAKLVLNPKDILTELRYYE